MSKTARTQNAMDALRMVSAGADPSPPVEPAIEEPRLAPADRAAPRQRTSITLTVEAYERLREIAFRSKRPLNDVFLDAIEAHLRAKGYQEEVR